MEPTAALVEAQRDLSSGPHARKLVRLHPTEIGKFGHVDRQAVVDPTPRQERDVRAALCHRHPIDLGRTEEITGVELKGWRPCRLRARHLRIVLGDLVLLRSAVGLNHRRAPNLPAHYQAFSPQFPQETTEFSPASDFPHRDPIGRFQDRKSTRLNSSHSQISYAVFCLKK